MKVIGIVNKFLGYNRDTFTTEIHSFIICKLLNKIAPLSNVMNVFL